MFRCFGLSDPSQLTDMLRAAEGDFRICAVLVEGGRDDTFGKGSSMTFLSHSVVIRVLITRHL